MLSLLQKIDARNKLYRDIRKFMAEQGIKEVEVPLMHNFACSQPFVQSFQVGLKNYLLTSPEVYMKRLLASECPDIFTICKAFRDGESSNLHNPEFSMLEYYRIDFSSEQLQQEVMQLLQNLLNIKQYQSYRFEDFMQQYCQLNVEQVTTKTLQQMVAKQCQMASTVNRDNCLQLLMDKAIQQYNPQTLVVISDFPASMAELAQVESNSCGNLVAKRFEIYCNGLELANGYLELNSSAEHKKRCHADNSIRKQNGLQPVAIDNAFIKDSGQLPPCAGVAIGLDRILMLQWQCNQISDVLLFPCNQPSN